VHEASGRARGPFVICDLGAVPGSLIESELFGHVRGAFTGADRDRAGAFEQADGGTIFLDEVGELALELQPRLLRVLETASVKRLGETRYRRTDARVISATNRHLSAEVQSDRFRSDLFYRLTVAQVRIPALRERLDDMPTLVDALLADLAMRGAGQLTASPELISALRAYDWPGNVRQLRNVIERAVALGLPGGILSPAVLGLDPDPGDESRVRHKIDASVPFKEAKDRLVVHWEREYVSSLLEKCAGNVSRAARVAGLDRAHLYRLLHRHGLLKPGK
jgi:DNA-binding NtrC family response regulator